MATPLGAEYGGARYHVMNHGDGQEAIFFTDADRGSFCRELAKRATRRAGNCMRIAS
jgi:hypothetical protein